MGMLDITVVAFAAFVSSVCWPVRLCGLAERVTSHFFNALVVRDT